jgi:Glycosyl hydrolases family 2, TIM barrel domain/Glycosyl hydrolases family 2/Glycosyl hydrolases family 2, sugar binding domain
MINRRNFLGTLGASAVISAVPVLATESEPIVLGSRTRISLHGEWERHIGEVLYDTVAVPSSLRPSGNYILNRSFVLPRLSRGERAFLHFEAIAFWGRVTVNGKTLGSTEGPYIPAEFEFTPSAKEGKNEVQVQIVDLTPLPDGSGTAEIILGHNPGWEATGGIIRDTWVEIRPASFVDNVRFAYTLNSDYSACSAKPRVLVSSKEGAAGTVEVVLRRGQTEVARATQPAQLTSGGNEVELAFELRDPVLWSPELPNLYDVTATLKTSSGEDSWSCRTGFRDIRTQGRDFLLNGKRLVLKGVCRHDLWREEGFTLSRRQQEQDMQMIKSIGCNFIRLVHYPHDRHIIELADQVGLLVSEEPGFWQVDFATAPRPTIEMGFHILEETIRRDWNSPAVMFWFLSNECSLTEAFLREGKERCNRVDPIKRLVSAANDRSGKKVKPMFVGADMDFFDLHLYNFDPEDFAREMNLFGLAKPFTFTEWGGKAIGQTDLLMRGSVDRLIDLIESGELAGTSFWSWQDLRDYSRIDGEMRGGVLESGVVTEAREPRDLVTSELTRLFELRRHVDEQPDSKPEEVPLKWPTWSKKNKFEPVDLQALAETADADRAWSSFKDRMVKYWDKIDSSHWKETGNDFLLWRPTEIRISGVDFKVPIVNYRARPLILTPEAPQIRIPLTGNAQRLHILGQVTFGEGFPVVGKDGEEIGSYTLEFANGKKREIPLRNGYEIAQAQMIRSGGRFDPTVSEAQRALVFVKDIAREQYQSLLLSIPAEESDLVALRCQLHGEQSPLAIFAITAERL